MTSYDLWKTNAPEPEYRPFRCSECRKRVENIEDHVEGEAHCVDEDTGEVGGTLEWDWSYDWRDDDPNIP